MVLHAVSDAMIGTSGSCSSLGNLVMVLSASSSKTCEYDANVNGEEIETRSHLIVEVEDIPFIVVIVFRSR